MKVINCKDEDEFAKHEKKACEHIGLPNAFFKNYATVEESGLRFPVISEIEHLFPAGIIVEYNGEDEQDDG